MTDATSPARDERELTLRYAATCSVCQAALAPRARAIWDRATKTARCVKCSVPAQAAPPAVEGPDPVPAVDFGVAGASAQRLFDTKEARRKERLRRDWWVLAIMAVAGAVVGGVLAHRLHTSVALWAVVGGALPVLDLIRRPQHIDAWRSGAAGERAVGKMLDGLRVEGVVAIHDRRVPGRRTNIDHIVVAPTGIFVVRHEERRGQGRSVTLGLARRRTASGQDAGWRRWPRRRRTERSRRRWARAVDGARRALFHEGGSSVDQAAAARDRPSLLARASTGSDKGRCRVHTRPGQRHGHSAGDQASACLAVRRRGLAFKRHARRTYRLFDRKSRALAPTNDLH